MNPRTLAPLALCLLIALAMAIPAVVQGQGKLELQVKTDKDHYEPGDTMVITGNLTRDGNPVMSNITFQVDDSMGDAILIMTKPTDDNGTATVMFRLDYDSQNGTYKIFGTASVADKNATSPSKLVNIVKKPSNPPKPFNWMPVALAGLFIAIIMGLVGAAVYLRNRAPAKAKPKSEAPSAARAFSIDDIFLMYKDGRLIEHQTRRLRPDQEKDKEVLSSMLSAIQSFVEESFTEGASLSSIEYGDNKILLEKGRYLCLALVITDQAPDSLREKMKEVVEKVEGLYAGIIEDWDGNQRKFKDVKGMLSPLLDFKQEAEGTAEPEKKIKILSGLEFYSGYVRLKVAVKNSCKTVLNDASFKLIYNKKTLRLSKVEPAFEREGSVVDLGNVDPGEKKTVAFYLDPLICMESQVDGILTYKDYEGNFLSEKMKRRPVDIVCPIFYTEQNINVAMLKRLISEAAYSDTRAFQIPKKVAPKKAMAVAKEAAASHAVKFVREFTEEDPYQVEAWYYGKVQESKEEMVIRVAVDGEDRRLEVHIASSNLATLTGLLAELAHEVTELMKERDLAPEGLERVEVPVSEAAPTKGEPAEMARTRFLIDKFAAAELEADETEQ